MERIKLFNDHFQNYKVYGIPKAQLIIADIPYNIGKNAYGSNPSWYIDGDNTNGESELAGKQFFDTDKDFRPPEFMHFCSKMLIKEPKEHGKAPCMIVFCAFEQQFQLIELAKKYGLNNYINLVFRKNFSAQVLKANMRIVGNCEYAVLFDASSHTSPISTDSSFTFLILALNFSTNEPSSSSTTSNLQPFTPSDVQ